MYFLNLLKRALKSIFTNPDSGKVRGVLALSFVVGCVLGVYLHREGDPAWMWPVMVPTAVFVILFILQVLTEHIYPPKPDPLGEKKDGLYPHQIATIEAIKEQPILMYDVGMGLGRSDSILAHPSMREFMKMRPNSSSSFKMKRVKFRGDAYETYVSEDGNYVMAREYKGMSPNYVEFKGMWVCRTFDGDYVDHDIYVNDLIERHILRGKDYVPFKPIKP